MSRATIFKKNVTAGSILLLGLLAIVSGCAVNDTSSLPQATVESYFYPLDNGVVYTYQRFFHNRNDTLQLRIEIGQPPSMQNILLDSKTELPYYYVGYSYDPTGNTTAGILATDTSTLIALEGSLEPNATWVADENNGIHATVVDRPYDDFYLPGRQLDYTDVLPVKYHQDGQPESNYTLRYFARGHGLILEQEFVGPGTQIASLQLISIQYPS